MFSVTPGLEHWANGTANSHFANGFANIWDFATLLVSGNW
jgi:hypothetical protein